MSKTAEVSLKIVGNYHGNKEIMLPEYGEVKVVTHGGKITFIETSTKEKVE